MSMKVAYGYSEHGCTPSSVVTYSKVLETEDVQHPDEARGIGSRVGAGVDLVHQPGEGAGVEGFCHGMPVLPSLELGEERGEESNA